MTYPKLLTTSILLQSCAEYILSVARCTYRVHIMCVSQLVVCWQLFRRSYLVSRIGWRLLHALQVRSQTSSSSFLVRSNTSDYRLFMSDNRLFTSRTHALSTATQDVIRFIVFSRTGKWPVSWSQLQERLLLICRVELSLFSSFHLPMPQLIRELPTRLLL